MGHGVTWFSFIPGWDQWVHALRENTHGVLGGDALLTHVASALLVALILLAVGVKASIDLKRRGEAAIIPSPEPSLLNFIEVALEWFYAQAHQIIGKETPRYFPIIAALAMFIFFSNVLGLVPGFEPPTNNWNTTAACSILVFLYYNFQGLRVHKLKHIAHMANPAGLWWGWFLAPLLFPIELVSHMARPFSLAVRLAANMVGDHAVLVAFLGLMPILVPIPFLALGLVVSIVQTLVFVLLTMVYIGMAVADSHDEEHEHEHEKPLTPAALQA